MSYMSNYVSYMSEVLCCEVASHLMGWKGCQFKVGIGVSTLTCSTAEGQVI